MAERAGFEPAEEREPLAGLANRCLGPLDYLSSGGILQAVSESVKRTDDARDKHIAALQVIRQPGGPSDPQEFAWQTPTNPLAPGVCTANSDEPEGFAVAEGAGFEPARP